MLNIQKQTFTFLRRYGIISVFQGTERKVKMWKWHPAHFQEGIIVTYFYGEVMITM